MGPVGIDSASGVRMQSVSRGVCMCVCVCMCLCVCGVWPLWARCNCDGQILCAVVSRMPQSGAEPDRAA